jgi:polyhydroxyalkanoate synthase
VSEPGHKGQRFHVLTREAEGLSLETEQWLERATPKQGSWWLEWGEWLARNSGEPVGPPPMGAPDKGYPATVDAPGRYILEQ